MGWTAREHDILQRFIDRQHVNDIATLNALPRAEVWSLIRQAVALALGTAPGQEREQPLPPWVRETCAAYLEARLEFVHGSQHSALARLVKVLREG